MAEYHKYVFDEEKKLFVGDFELMYKAEKTEYFDSWHQEDLRNLSKKICFDILEDYNFQKIIDVGCGKGTFTHFLKKANNEVIGVDISETALKHAKGKYPDISFFRVNMNSRKWFSMKAFKGQIFDCVILMEILSYLQNWKDIIRLLSTISQYMFIVLFVPSKPLGFVKSMDELVDIYQKHFNIIENVVLVNREHIILFGSSKNLKRSGYAGV